MRGFYHKCFLLVVAVVLLHSASAAEISEKGKELAIFLDGRDVENLWLSKRYVEWESGKATEKEVTDGKSHTHCSAFVASTAKALGIFILRPPEHSATLLANAQYTWLSEKGKESGWKLIETGEEAQKAANEGLFVVAAYRESDPKTPGHIAIVRPSEKSKEKIAEEGPQIIQAGGTNMTSGSMKRGFGNHKGAFERREILFFSHEIEQPLK